MQGQRPRTAAGRGPSPVGQKILLDVVAVGLEQRLGAAQLADRLGGALDHAVALAGLLKQRLPAGGDLEALLGAGLGLDLGHLALLYAGASAGCGPPPRWFLARNEPAG